MKNKILLELLILVSLLVPLIFFYSGCTNIDDLGTLFQHYIDPFEVTIERGDSVNIDVHSGGDINLSLIDNSIAPFIVDELIYYFDPGTIPPGASSSILHITVPAAVPPGTYDVLVLFSDIDDDISETSELRLIVIDPTPDFNIAFEPKNITIEQGKTDTTAIIITRLNGNTESINFVPSFPSGINADIFPWDQVTGNSTSVVISVDQSLPPGNYKVGATGVGNTTGRGRTDTLNVTVTATAENYLWNDVTPPGGIDPLNDVYFTDASTGYAVGNNGTILKTTDEGVTWFSQSSGTGENLTAVEFFDANFGVAVGWNGTVIKTQNGGTTWNSINPGTNSDLLAVYIIDNQNIWVGGGNPFVYSTSDGGNNWEQKHINVLTGQAAILGIWFRDDTTGVFVGNTNQKVVHTTDAGQSWSFVNIGEIQINDIFPQSNLSAIAVGQSSKIWHTGDGGLSWSFEDIGIGGGLNAIHSNGGLTTAVGSLGGIVSLSGGSWELEETEIQQFADDLRGVSVFPDGQHAIAVGGNANGVIIRRVP